MPTLVIHAPDGAQTSIELGEKPIKLGRADTCDYVLLNDGEISREHVEIWLDADRRIVVCDKGSKNGTRADDGEPFRSARRYAQRSIRVGEHLIKILGTPSPPDAPTPVTFANDEDTNVGDTQFFPSSRGLDLSQQRLALLIQLSERIGGVFERRQLLEQALDACCEALGFERGLIALKTQRGDTELPTTRNVQRDESGEFKVSRTLINRALIHGERAIVNNPATDLAGDLSESLVRFPICSALCVPVLNRGEILGVIYGDRITQASTYQPEDVDFLAAIAQQVGVGLANLRLMHEHVRSQHIYAELDAARKIQRRLLPAKPLESDRIVIAGHNEPSSAVSGDYFDFFEIDTRRVGLIIADVTGHGLPAALVMANLQAAIRVALAPDVDLIPLARRVNRLICQNTSSDVFVTGILGRVDLATGAIEYVSAGHPPPILLRSGEASEAPAERNSLPLGIEPDESYEVVRLDPTDGVEAAFFYTDGIVEAANPEGELLGLDAVVDTLTSLSSSNPLQLIHAAQQTVREHLGGAPQADDMTILAAQFRGDSR